MTVQLLKLAEKQQSEFFGCFERHFQKCCTYGRGSSQNYQDSLQSSYTSWNRWILTTSSTSLKVQLQILAENRQSDFFGRFDSPLNTSKTAQRLMMTEIMTIFAIHFLFLKNQPMNQWQTKFEGRQAPQIEWVPTTLSCNENAVLQISTKPSVNLWE